MKDAEYTLKHIGNNTKYIDDTLKRTDHTIKQTDDNLKHMDNKSTAMKLCAMNNHWRFYDLQACFQSISEQGYEFIEVWTGPMHFYVDYAKNEDVSKLLSLSNRYGVQIIGICPEQTNPKPNNLASATRIEDIFNYYKRIIDITHECGAKQVTITSGWMYLDEDREQAYCRSVQMMKKLAQYARPLEINLVMEALQKDESRLVNTSLELAKYLSDVDMPNLKICLDFGAMAGAKESIEDYFKHCKENIAHIHFVDGDPTGHLAFPDGSRDILEDLQTLKNFGYSRFLSCESVNSRYFEKPWEADQSNMNAYTKAIKEII